MLTMAIILTYVFASLPIMCRVGTLLAWYYLKEDKSHLYYSGGEKRQTPSQGHWCAGMTVGVIAGLVWPLMVFPFTARRVLFAPPYDVRIKQRALALKKREEEIRRLDKELGITDTER
jgi:hypothetical protein